jgi:hypothetical protein
VRLHKAAESRTKTPKGTGAKPAHPKDPVAEKPAAKRSGGTKGTDAKGPAKKKPAPKAATKIGRAAKGFAVKNPAPKMAAAAPGPVLHWRTPTGRAALAMVRSLALILLALAVFEALRITLVPTPNSVVFSRPNMHPFATIRLYLHDGTVEERFLQIGGNIAMGFVLGFLLPQITPRLRGLLRVEAVTAVLISAVDLLQHLAIRGTSVNIDDLILAGAGAALGYVPLGRMFGMRLHPHHLHWWQRILARSVDRGRRRPATRRSA